ncbi:hypothetical protein GDO81_014811 [Engystomops pustulosus]|uniref:Ig-like domain-containing protein n=2 Tax=Engystomops pustulosus TaxID=76066 RepID=A0AAV7AL20_ENGPU|nr:hypothetical protein GDO81_014811 [Engystomops pustulosus]
MRRSNSINIWIQELFSPPVLEISSDLINEGDNMTLSCDTNLSEHRLDTSLQYAFYRDGGNVQGFSSSNKYEVQFISVENSGTYTCEIQTSDTRVRKRSLGLHIQGSGDSSSLTTILFVSLGLLLLIVIVCIFLYIYYQRKSSNKERQTLTASENEYPNEGEINYAVLAMTSRAENHLAGDNGSSVVYTVVNSKTKPQGKTSQGTSDSSADIYQNIPFHR